MNVKEVVPFLHVSSMERSIRFYIDGLGFAFRHKWETEGKLRWCWLTLGGASLMLQEFAKASPLNAGSGITLNFTCEDAIALYHLYQSRGLNPSEPEVGNGLWVTEVVDPDGYKLFFNSSTDVAEDTKLSEVARS
jgi:catechol 2,3-dioxygenase-like lactoylglutathione lyase family enzyme